MNSRCFHVFTLLLAIAAGTKAAENWPQFRGPAGDGHARAVDPPVRFDEAKNPAWKTAIEGAAFSSPVISGGRIWLTTAVVSPATPEEASRRLEGERFARSFQVAEQVVLRVVCLDRGTGRQIYDVAVFRLNSPAPIQGFNSYASPTPIIEGSRLYCDFGAYGTACLDAATGKKIWVRHLSVEHFVGPGSSPTLCGDLLVLVRDGGDQQYVAALKKQTGQTVWKTVRPPIDASNPQQRKAFSTPLLVTADGRRQLIIPGAQWVVAYEPQTGEEIWRASYGDGFSNVPRPVYGHAMVYICTGFPRPELWAIRVNGRGDVTDTHVVWKAMRQIPKRSSPLLVGNEIYLVSDGGIATCFDAISGKVHWQERLDGDYSASPILAHDRIYFFSESGDITVIRPGTTYRELAKSRINGRMKATPAVVGNSMFIRTDTHVCRFTRSE